MLVWLAGTWWMCDVLARFEGWLVMCRVSGCGLCLPVKVWPSGADWMTLSFANCSCDGATMLRPGGAPRLRAKPGVFAAKWLGSFSLSGPSPSLADCCCNLASMIWRWCSLTLMLRFSCSCSVASFGTKPGDRHAMPTSWITRPSRAVIGRPVAGDTTFVFLDRSSFLGRCLAVCMPGEPGSFLTMIFGRELCVVEQNGLVTRTIQTNARRMCASHTYIQGFAYALGGDDFCVFAAAPKPLGLPLPDRGCGAGALLEAAGAGGGGGGAAIDRWALGEVVVGGGRSEP